MGYDIHQRIRESKQTHKQKNMNYTDDQISQAFRLAYLYQHGTLDGWQDAFDWWLHPQYKCLQQEKPTKKEIRCHKICQTCFTLSK